MRRVARPQPDRVHRLKRRWRFLANARLEALALQVAVLPHPVAARGRPRRRGRALDGTRFDPVRPAGVRARDQGWRVALPRRGRASPVVPLAADRDALPADQGQNQRAAAALRALRRALPAGVRPVVRADRGVARAPCLAWRRPHGAACVVRVTRGTCLTEAAGTRGTRGPRDPPRGRLSWPPLVRDGRDHGRPRAVTLTLAPSWRRPRHQARAPRHHPPAAPWSRATARARPAQAAAWSRQRGGSAPSGQDRTARFGLARVQVGCPQRLSRRRAALTRARAWLALLARPETRLLPPRWRSAVAPWGRPSTTALALHLLDHAAALPCPYS